MGKFVHHAIYKGLATVRMERPDLHNAFNDQVVKELTTTFVDLGTEPDARVIVLAGEGKSFCAGADLNWMQRMVDYTFDQNVDDAMRLASMLQTIRDCPKPVIARVHGAAFGGGVGLVAACDMAVALNRAFFCLSEVKLGIVPAVISPFLVEKIGLSAARRYGLTAERFDAEEARRIGLVHEIRDTVEDLDECIHGLADALQQGGPAALTTCKQILSEVSARRTEDCHDATARCIARIRVSGEGQEGLKAFLEKRKPAWSKET